MKQLVILIGMSLFVLGINRLAMADGAGRGIGTEQSCHNFSHESWLPVVKICVTCHIPHTGRKRKKYGIPETLSWKRKINSITYNLFDASWSPSLFGTHATGWISPVTGKQSGLPDGLSKLCLGCHDGIIAQDVFNLHHFVSVEYDLTKTELRDPDLTKMGVSGIISDVLHFGKIQCSSCHDAHDEETVANTKLLRVEKEKLCTTCHRK